jgi:hypothetical protein
LVNKVEKILALVYSEETTILLPNIVEKRVELVFKVDTFTVDAVIVLPNRLENAVEFAFKVDTFAVETST